MTPHSELMLSINRELRYLSLEVEALGSLVVKEDVEVEDLFGAIDLAVHEFKNRVAVASWTYKR